VAERKEMMESLEGAIYREIGARDFYSAIAGSISNKEGSERFAQLSRDEEGHRESLEGWYLKLFETPFEASGEKLKESEITGFSVDDETGALAALDIAIEAESRASDYYKERAGEASDEELKKMFLRLAEDEEGHYNLLQAERNSLIGGFYWFDMDDTRFME
jgi:rubrerythrin